MTALGGVTLADGLYRVFSPSAVPAWTSTAMAAFPEFRARATVFAADWLGRLFAADPARANPDGEAQVLMLEPGTGEAREIPVSVGALHTSELLDATEALVAEPFYRAWRRASGDSKPLLLTECVGYRVPLFLGGSDDEANLARTDMDVYWSLLGQARLQTEHAGEGTPVSAVRADKPRARLWRTSS
jgi:hypothetical protein